MLDFVTDFALALDHDDAFQSGPVVTLLQPGDVMDRRVSSGLDATAVDGLVSAHRCVLEAIGLLLGDENLNILAQRALIAFEGEQIILPSWR